MIISLCPRRCGGRRNGMALLCGLWLLMAGLAAQAQSFDEDHKEKINGTTLHFRVRGTDRKHPYLVLLHEGPGYSSHMLLPWGASLEKTVNVVYLDQRGCGESEQPAIMHPVPTPEERKGFTVANMVEDIEGVRAFLKVNKWHVLGHAWGGMLGVEYVAAHTDHILTYIHMNGLLSLPMMAAESLDNAEAKFKAQAKTDDPNKKQAMERYLRMAAAYRRMPIEDPERLFNIIGLAMGPADLYIVQHQAVVAYFSKVTEQMRAYKTPDTVLHASIPLNALTLNDHYHTRDITPLLSKISVPTLIINGKQDGMTTPKSAEIAHKNIKGSRLVLLDDCGHFPFAEQSDKTAAAVLEFITGDHGFRGGGIGDSF